jgi:hypothetical protein
MKMAQMTEPVHIISLGAGVQSSTMALMAAKGELPDSDKVRAAIFADTQAEPKSVYEWLDWLEKQLPFPVIRVTAGSLTDRALKIKVSKDGRRYSKTDIPFFTRADDGSLGKIMGRGCTADFKIRPLQKAQREIAGIKRGQKTIGVICWIGISLDEVRRMKPSTDAWSKNIWPLVEARMSRHDCITWMEKNNYPKPPRSACVYCPFHSNQEWRRLKTEEPEAFLEAVQFERNVQAVKSTTDNFRSIPFLHQSCTPLDQVDLSTDLDRGQGELNLFNNECTGLCGV